MVLSVLVFVTLAACIHDAASHHIRDDVYKKMCDKSLTFKEELVKCLDEMPAKDQMILRFCGSVFGNGTVEDFGGLVDDTCNNGKYANKVAHCMDTVTHMVFHLNNNTEHHHDDDDDHHFDFGHGVYNEECFQTLYKSYGIAVSKDHEHHEHNEDHEHHEGHEHHEDHGETSSPS